MDVIDNDENHFAYFGSLEAAKEEYFQRNFAWHAITQYR